MNKYGGQVIHQSHDEMGILEVVENDSQRSLHFGSTPKQSTMDLNDPLRLCLSYTRAMLSGLLFIPDPRRILCLGLGGGSLVKFLLHHFPCAHIDAVEIRHKVIQLAHGYFCLPESAQLHIHHTEAADFIQNEAIELEPYDLILVDAFTREGLSETVGSEYFFTACRHRLAETGILVCNLWGRQKALKLILDNLRQAQFGRRPLLLPVEGKDNLIALGVANSAAQQPLKKLKPRALDLQAQLDIEFPALLRQLQRSNRWPFER